MQVRAKRINTQSIDHNSVQSDRSNGVTISWTLLMSMHFIFLSRVCFTSCFRPRGCFVNVCVCQVTHGHHDRTQATLRSSKDHATELVLLAAAVKYQPTEECRAHILCLTGELVHRKSCQALCRIVYAHRHMFFDGIVSRRSLKK